MPFRKSLKTLSKINILLSLFLFVSCSTPDKPANSLDNIAYKKRYTLEDKSGRFLLEREVGFSKNKKVFSKYLVKNIEGDQAVLERSIVLSSIGTYNKKFRLLRPYAHQYQVWFDKNKYSSEGKINLKKKSMDIRLKSPEEQWNKSEIHRFPDSQSGAFCYFSQIIECAKISGFISKAVSRNTGAMYLTLVWEGFPYIQEQYLNIPQGFFTAASLEYDGENKNGEKRFTLKFGENAIFYFLDDRLHLSKVFWPSQGLSIVELGKSSE